MAGLSVVKKVVLGSVLVMGLSANAQTERCDDIIGADFVDAHQMQGRYQDVGQRGSYPPPASFERLSEAELRAAFPEYEQDLGWAVSELIEDSEVLELTTHTVGLNKKDARNELVHQKTQEMWSNNQTISYDALNVVKLLAPFGYSTGQVWAAIEFVATR